MAASRRDCAARRGGHCVTNTGSGFSCVISTITNREYAGGHWSVTRRYRRFATNNGVLINCCRTVTGSEKIIKMQSLSEVQATL